jgi:hypothetical protein
MHAFGAWRRLVQARDGGIRRTALLHDMCELVRQKVLAHRCFRLVLARAEHDVGADRVSVCVVTLG